MKLLCFSSYIEFINIPNRKNVLIKIQSSVKFTDCGFIIVLLRMRLKTKQEQLQVKRDLEKSQKACQQLDTQKVSLNKTFIYDFGL